MKHVQISYELVVSSDMESTITNSYLGKKEENKIEFSEGSIDVSLILEEEKVVMNRITDEYQIEMIFKKDGILKGRYEIVGMDPMDLIVTTKKLEVKEDKIEVIYILNLNKENIGKFHFTLEYEVLS